MGEYYRSKPYQTLLEEALTDESQAGEMYRYMANVSPDASAAERLRKIADDEDRHHLMLSHLLAELSGVGETGGQYEQRMEYLLGHRHPSQVSTGIRGRPFPRTYGDWVDLAEDIKTKYAGDPVGKASVNYQLQQIAEGTEQAEEAKRWLVRKAGELGVD